jgi:hypothetical protein
MLLIISPEGRLRKGEWKSGFYHIAKGCNAEIMVMGVDFVEFKSILYPVRVDPNTMSYEEAKNVLSRGFRTITPLHPDCSEPEPRILDAVRNRSFMERLFIKEQWQIWLLTPIPISRLAILVLIMFWCVTMIV